MVCHKAHESASGYLVRFSAAHPGEQMCKLMFLGLMKYEGGCAGSLRVTHPEGLLQHLLRSASAKFCETVLKSCPKCGL